MTVLVTTVAMVTLGCGVVRTPLSDSPDVKPAPLPGNLCALVGDTLLEQVVPSHGTLAHRATPGSFVSHAYCTVETDAKKATSTAKGWLDIELQRHGSVTQPSEAEAWGEFKRGCENYYDSPSTYGPTRRVDGLKQPACAAVTEGDGRATVHLLVLAGADVVDVTYRAEPSTDDRALAAAEAVATNVVARM